MTMLSLRVDGRSEVGASLRRVLEPRLWDPLLKRWRDDLRRTHVEMVFPGDAVPESVLRSFNEGTPLQIELADGASVSRVRVLVSAISRQPDECVVRVEIIAGTARVEKLEREG